MCLKMLDRLFTSALDKERKMAAHVELISQPPPPPPPRTPNPKVSDFELGLCVYELPRGKLRKAN